MPQTLNDLVLAALHDDFAQSKYGARAKQAVQDAIRNVARRAHLPAGEATVTVAVSPQDRDYAPGVDATHVTAVERADGRELDQVAPEFIDASPNDSGARATAFAYYGGQLVLYPMPTQATTVLVRFRRLPATLQDTDEVATVTGIPEDFLSMLVCFARSRLFAFEDDDQMSAFWRNEYERDLRGLRSDLGTVQRVRNKRVPGPYRV